MSDWDFEQEKQGIPPIDRTYKVRKPNGEVTEVNRFDMNLTLCAKPESWIQCSDSSWLLANRLEIIGSTHTEEVKAMSAKNRKTRSFKDKQCRSCKHANKKALKNGSPCCPFANVHIRDGHCAERELVKGGRK